MNEPLEIIVSLLRDQFELKLEVLTSDTTLRETGLDSLDIIKFLFSLEEKTGVNVPDAAFVEEPIETLGHLAAYVKKQAG